MSIDLVDFVCYWRVERCQHRGGMLAFLRARDRLRIDPDAADGASTRGAQGRMGGVIEGSMIDIAALALEQTGRRERLRGPLSEAGGGLEC